MPREGQINRDGKNVNETDRPLRMEERVFY